MPLTSTHIISKKKGQGNVRGGPLSPPPIPDNGGGGGGTGSPLNMGSVGKYIPSPHPYADRPINAVLPITIHTEYGKDATGASIGAFVDVVFTDSGNRATNTATLQNAINTNCVLNQNTRMLLPSVFPMNRIDCKEITNPGKWIYIQRSTEPTAAGIRVNPTIMATAPEFLVPSTDSDAVAFYRKASRYYFMGCRFGLAPGVTHCYYMIRVEPSESGTVYNTDTTNLNNDVIFDRCLMQGNDIGAGAFVGNLRHCVTLNGARLAVVNCYLHQLTSIGEESHAFLLMNTPGPIKIVNNFVECAAIGTLFGGGLPAYGLVSGKPSDIEYRHNHHTKRLSWCPQDPSWDGVTGRNGKGLFETKNVQRLLVEGNVFDREWYDGQTGMIVVFKSGGAGTTTEPAGISSLDVTIRYNKISNSRRPWDFQGIDQTTDFMQRICAYDNLLYNMGEYPPGQKEGTFLITHRVDDLYIRHNTIIYNQITNGKLNYDLPQSPRSQRHTFSDNLLMTGSPDYGIFMSGGATGANALNAWAENPYHERNIFIGPYTTLAKNSLLFNSNQVATDLTAMNFANAATFDFHLTPSSPGKGAGVGGKDLGADIDLVNLATSGVAAISCGLITSLATRPLSTFAKPAYNTPVIEPDFGTKVIRITGDPGTTIPVVGGTWSTMESYEYSKTQPWNADMSLLRISRRGTSPSQLFLNGSTYVPVVARSFPGNEGRWHTTDPNSMIVVKADATIVFWNPITNGQVTKFSTTGYTNAQIGEYEGNQSYDNHWIVIDALRTSDSKQVAFVVDLIAGTKGADLDIVAQGCSNLDWVSITAGGGFVVLHGIIDGLVQRSKVYDRATLTLVSGGNWNDIQQGHHDLGLALDNTELAFIGAGNGTLAKKFYTRQLSNGVEIGPISPLTSFNWHASTRNYLRKGWGYVVTNDTTGSVVDGEMYALKFNNPAAINIERYGRHRTTGSAYERSAFACPSPDGKRIAFGSDWGDAAGPIQGYVIDARNICP